MAIKKKKKLSTGKKKKRRNLTNLDFSNVSVPGLNIDFDLNKASQNRFQVRPKSPVTKEYLSKESFDKLYDTEFSEFKAPKGTVDSSDPYGDALALFLSGQMTAAQKQEFLQVLLGQTTFGEITNFENPEQSVGDNYTYAFGDGTPLFNPTFIQNLQTQLETLGLDLDDVLAQLQGLESDNENLSGTNTALQTDNDSLIAENAALSGQVIALQNQLGGTPIITECVVEPSTSSLQSNGVSSRVTLRFVASNTDTKTINIYRIEPGTNSGTTLDASTIEISNVTFTGTGRFIGNTGSNRLVNIQFLPESVYAFECIAFNSQSEQTAVQVAFFTTVDTDATLINNLENQIDNLENEADADDTTIENLETQIDNLETDLSDKNQEYLQAVGQLAPTRDTLNNFSDNILTKINLFKETLIQEEITDTTFQSFNSMITTFNQFVNNINENTPTGTPVTEIPLLDADEVDFELSTIPENFPSWAGGDGIVTIDNDNTLFENGFVLETNPFTIPDQSYRSNNVLPGLEDLSDAELESKVVVGIRLKTFKLISPGNTPISVNVNGNIVDGVAVNSMTSRGFGHDVSKTPLSLIHLNSSGEQIRQINLLDEDSYIFPPDSNSGLGEKRTIGHDALAEISGAPWNDNPVVVLRGGDSFKIKLKDIGVAYPASTSTLGTATNAGGLLVRYSVNGNTLTPNNTAHSYSVQFEMDFVTLDDENNYNFYTRLLTGTFRRSPEGGE